MYIIGNAGEIDHVARFRNKTGRRGGKKSGYWGTAPLLWSIVEEESSESHEEPLGVAQGVGIFRFRDKQNLLEICRKGE